MNAKVEQDILKELHALPDDPEACKHGTYLWCERCVQSHYSLGIDVGFEHATTLVAETIAALAGKKFMEGNDNEAKAYRTLAETLDTKLKEQRKAFQKSTRPK